MKRAFWISFSLFLIFSFGIIVENKIKYYLGEHNYFKEKQTEIIKPNPSTSIINIDYDETREKAVILRVIDGDTIELEDKRRIRYIGINAPEITDKRKEVLCFARMAKDENAKLVEGKVVEMEKDISDKDKYDRLLRYVWIDGEMVNLKLIKSGHAKTATYPPDVKYKDLFLEAEKTAPEITCNKI